MESEKQHFSSSSSVQSDESLFAVRLTQEELAQFSSSSGNALECLFHSRAMAIRPIGHPTNPDMETISTDTAEELDQVFLVRDKQELFAKLTESLLIDLGSTFLGRERRAPCCVDEDEHIEPEDEEEELQEEDPANQIELDTPPSATEEEPTPIDSPSPTASTSATDDEGSISLLEEEASAEMKEEEIKLPVTETTPAAASTPHRIVFNLSNLPSFNMAKIISSLSVRERLAFLCPVSKRFRACVYQPQCFTDVSFFPVLVKPIENSGEDKTDGLPQRPAPPRKTVEVPVEQRQPKMLHVRGVQATHQSSPPTGITYVEVCMESQHPFVVKVARYAGMWNFKAELWDKINWPSDLVIESLQLSIEANTNRRVLNLRDELPRRSRTKISNLFLIKFEMDGFQPKIFFPQKLQGIGLQSFNSTCFATSWWKNQVFTDGFGIFDSIIFLVLSCCDFEKNQLQKLIHRVEDRLEHLSLRYVKWDGWLKIPNNLLSLGWFPERATNFFRFDRSKPNRLWQLQTRLAENLEATVDMLNCVHELCPNLRRISFEYVRAHEEWHATKLNIDSMKVWGNVPEKMAEEEEGGIDSNGEEEEEVEMDERFSSMVIVVDPVQWNHQPELESVFVLSEHQFVHPNKTSFLDCPLWSEDARSFISMTVRRKLLLR